jgi:hypothetical protein
MVRGDTNQGEGTSSMIIAGARLQRVPNLIEFLTTKLVKLFTVITSYKLLRSGTRFKRAPTRGHQGRLLVSDQQ